MKPMDLLEAMGSIRDGYIVEAKAAPGKKEATIGTSKTSPAEEPLPFQADKAPRNYQVYRGKKDGNGWKCFVILSVAAGLLLAILAGSGTLARWADYFAGFLHPTENPAQFTQPTEVTEPSQESVIHRPEGNERYPTGDWTTPSGKFESVCWEMPQSDDPEERCLRYTVSNPRVVTHVSDLDGFLSNCVVSQCTDGVYHNYFYPDFIDASGELLYGIRMVLIDVTVENPYGANNRNYQDPNTGNVLSDPYLFRIRSVGMVSEEVSFHGGEAAYYSLRNSCPEKEDGFSVAPGGAVSFQLGYLITNRADGSVIQDAELALSLTGQKSPWWFKLFPGE